MNHKFIEVCIGHQLMVQQSKCRQERRNMCALLS